MEENHSDKPAHRFARDIARAMGPVWRYDNATVTSNRCAYMDGPNAARLCIILDPWYDDPEIARRDYRLKVIGCYARFLRDDIRPHKHEAPEITCAPSRGPVAIAGAMRGYALVVGVAWRTITQIMSIGDYEGVTE